MIIGFSGAHRSGKTTLAQVVAAALHFDFVDASVSKIMAEGGFDGVAKLSIAERLEAQRYLLRRHIEMLQKIRRPTLIDRTPADMAAYLFGEITMHSEGIDQAAFSSYLTDCLFVMKTYFAGFIVPDILPVYVEQAGKPPVNRAYQQHHHLLVQGVLVQSTLPFMTLETPDIAQRIAECATFIKAVADQSHEAAPMPHVYMQ